jgi:O-antigen/teichoic acid export membrane protein
MNRGGRPATLVHAAVGTYATNLGVALLSLVNVLVVARVLGPSGRGDVAFLIAVALVSAHIVSLSLHESNANLAASHPDLRPALATNALLWALALGVVAAVSVMALAAVVPAVGGEVSRALLLVALACVPAVLLKLYLGLLVQADYGFAATNASWLAGPLTTAITNGVLALAGVLTVTTAIGAWACGQLLGTTLLCAYIVRHAGFGRPDAALARRSLSFGLKAHVGRLMQVGNYRADQWLLGAIAGSRELGLYSIAVAWAELLVYIPGVLVLVQRPDLVRADAEHAARRAARVCRAAFLVSAAAAAGLIVAAPALCVTVFGERFQDSIPQLRVLALGALGIVALELLTNVLTAQRRPMLGSAAFAVAFILTLGLDLILIPPFGGMGAAVATAIGYSGGGVAAALIFTRAMRRPLRELVPRTADVSWLSRTAAALALPARRAPH